MHWKTGLIANQNEATKDIIMYMYTYKDTGNEKKNFTLGIFPLVNLLEQQSKYYYLKL